MVADESLEETVKQDLLRRNFIERNKCANDIQPSSRVTYCVYHGTDICKSSKHYKQCNYVRERG